MTQAKDDQSTAETLLSAWMKSATELWISMTRAWFGISETSEGQTQPENTPKRTRMQESWESTLKMWEPILSKLSEPDAPDAFSKGMEALPEIVLKMMKAGWEGYFELQQREMERIKRIGKHTEAYKFEDLDQNIFRAWSDIYEKEFRQFLTIPQLGLTSLYQTRINKAVDKFNVFQAAAAEFSRLLFLPIEKSFRIMQEKVGELTKEGKHPESTREYYLIWLRILEGHYMTLFKSPEYSAVLSNTLDAMEEFLGARKNVIQDMLQTLPVATSRDMDELSKKVYLLNKKVKELAKKVEKE